MAVKFLSSGINITSDFPIPINDKQSAITDDFENYYNKSEIDSKLLIDTFNTPISINPGDVNDYALKITSDKILKADTFQIHADPEIKFDLNNISFLTYYPDVNQTVIANLRSAKNGTLYATETKLIPLSTDISSLKSVLTVKNESWGKAFQLIMGGKYLENDSYNYRVVSTLESSEPSHTKWYCLTIHSTGKKKIVESGGTSISKDVDEYIYIGDRTITSYDTKGDGEFPIKIPHIQTDDLKNSSGVSYALTTDIGGDVDLSTCVKNNAPQKNTSNEYNQKVLELQNTGLSLGDTATFFKCTCSEGYFQIVYN